MATPADTGAAGKDRFIKIGSFTDSSKVYDALYVKARQFPTERAATTFMTSVSSSASSCPSGYSLTDNGNVFWTTESFRVERDPALSYGGALSVISDEEVLAPGGVDAGYRSVLLRRGTAVVAVVSEIASDRDVDFTAADSIVSAVAKRLAKLP